MNTIYTLTETSLPGGAVTLYVTDLTGGQTIHSFRTIAHARNYIATRHGIEKRVRMTRQPDGSWQYVVKTAV